MLEETMKPAPEARPFACFETPLGWMRVEEDARGIALLDFVDNPESAQAPKSSGIYLPDAIAQISEYFAGKRRVFDLPLNPSGTDFQKRVWNALTEIPYGETRSYRDVAAAVGKPKATRAVGMANHRNHICILIPCHRIIGNSGALTGYGGGLWRKRRLLELEAAHK